MTQRPTAALAGLLLAAGCAVPALAAAADATPVADAPAATSGWSGTVGAGPILFPRYAGSKSTQAWVIPLVSANYDNVVYIEPLRAGAYLWGSADRKMGLGVAFEPRMGFKGSDAGRLTGMATRHDSLEGGPAFDWDLGPVAVSVSLFRDLTGASRGGSGRLYVLRDLAGGGALNITGFVGMEWLGDRVANYFYGVREGEAAPGRPAYQATATTNATAGLGGRYDLSRSYAVVFGFQSTRMGGKLADSPIVDTRMSSVAWLGLAFRL